MADRHPSSLNYLVSIFSPMQKAVFGSFVLLWLVNGLYFWVWWMQQFTTTVGYIVSTLLLAWIYAMSLYFLYFASKMKIADPTMDIPEFRVAMVVTKAPSEPWELVKKTLEAMLEQKHPHDTWLADEKPTTEVLEWCYTNNVSVSTRDGVSEYHNEQWPRRTKSKEGNLAYFYDYYGYEQYDVVVQLDADHVPGKNYLEEMIRPFNDPEVGYVSAPSICDANADESWGTRARLYAESTMHGILQAGYTDGWAPLCIGSHYAVRTSALKEIGGLGPELAEDHSTTLTMNAYGWKGVHAFNAEAHGDGPATFTDFMTQEFQWSRSLIVLLFTLTPKLINRLSLKLKFQFLFSQIWYPSFAIMMLIGILLPLIALIQGQPIVHVSYIAFLLHSTPATLTLLGLLWWMKTQGWLRSQDSRIISWEAVAFQLVRWPWVLWGFIAAVIGVIRKKQLPFKVTPKGDITFQPIPLKVLVPYFMIILVTLITVVSISNPGGAKGYYYFALLNLVMYIAVVCTIIVKHIKERYLYE